MNFKKIVLFFCSCIEPIKVVVEPKDVAAIVQTTVTFNCKEPTGSYLYHIEIEWLLNDKPVDSGNQSRIIKTGSNLTITKITEMDSGNYTCVAKTNLNNATASAMLIVQVHNHKLLTNTRQRGVFML